jgi:hypothetical protein
MANFSRRGFLKTSALAAAPLAGALPGLARAASPDVRAIAEDAYIWGLPLVLQERYLALARTQGHPINRFTLSTGLSTPDDKVAGPNVDTLYGFAWLDLEREPIVLHVPDTADRYYSIQFMDAWANVFRYVGRRTTGTHAGAHAIVGPHWNGTLPAGVARIDAPTDRVLSLTRTLVRGEDDLAAAQAVQNQYTLTPLSRLSEPRVAPITVPSAIGVFPILNPAAARARYFDELGADLMLDPAPALEAWPLDRFARAGIGPRSRPSLTGDAAILEQAVAAADERIKAANYSTLVNGWRVSFRIVPFIQDPLERAAANRLGPGGHIADEALYFFTRTDGGGKPLDGSARYRLHYAPGQLPPVDAFWSLILYGPDFFLTRNAINRYSIGDRTAGVVTNSDGSLDIFVQHDEPAQGKSNWLPSPAASYQLILRTYQPRPEILSQAWKPPVLERVG